MPLCGWELILTSHALPHFQQVRSVSPFHSECDYACQFAFTTAPTRGPTTASQENSKGNPQLLGMYVLTKWYFLLFDIVVLNQHLIQVNIERFAVIMSPMAIPVVANVWPGERNVAAKISQNLTFHANQTAHHSMIG
jgi:hypothetical protein